MAAALPLAGVAAWRVYLDLPMHGRRQLPGGLGEFMQLGYADAVLRAFEPQVSQAMAEFPAVLAALRTRLPVADGPIGVLGGSIRRAARPAGDGGRIRASQRGSAGQPGHLARRGRGGQ